MPGDKSISHRAAMITAMATGVSRITNFSTSVDCATTLTCLEQLGIAIERDGPELLIQGVGVDGLRVPSAPLNCGNSGTTMRLLAGILAGQNFRSELSGDASLSARPMQRIIEPLEMMGANISADDGRAPLVIEGRRPLSAITYELLVASAQVKSCVLLAGLYANGRTEVIENEATRDHTERMLQFFEIPVETGAAAREGAQSRFAAVSGPAQLRARSVSVPGDISSAAYFIAAAALIPGSSITIDKVGINPSRIAFLSQLASLGFHVSVTDAGVVSNEPIGAIEVRGAGPPQSSEHLQPPYLIDGLMIPQLIDELPLMAVVGSSIDNGLEIRDAAELRVKESDRIAATAAGLRAMGAEVEEFADGLRVAGRARLRGAQIDSGGDHRIAMAFSIAGLLADGETEIKDADCVAVSFPEFFHLLDSVIQ